jgi:transposase
MDRPPSKLQTDYMRVPEVAERTGYSVYTVHFWLNTGKVKGVQPGEKGATRYVEIASLIEYLGEEAAKVCGILPDEESTG